MTSTDQILNAIVIYNRITVPSPMKSSDSLTRRQQPFDLYINLATNGQNKSSVCSLYKWSIFHHSLIRWCYTRFIYKKLLANSHLVEIDILKGKQHFLYMPLLRSILYSTVTLGTMGKWLVEANDRLYIRWVNLDLQLRYAMIQVLLLQWGILLMAVTL